MRHQRGMSLTNLIVGLGLLAFFGVMAAKIVPAYIEFYQVKKIFAAMEQGGDFNGTVSEIRNAYNRRNTIEDVKSVQGNDLEVTKGGGETVVTATWAVKVPLIYNASACLDFSVTNAK
jgi:hypothetical protein